MPAGLIAELIRRDLPFYDTAISIDAVAGLNVFARDMGLISAIPADCDVVAPGASA
jgi:NitT/TauT family transport system substrate-binding protein